MSFDFGAKKKKKKGGKRVMVALDEDAPALPTAEVEATPPPPAPEEVVSEPVPSSTPADGGDDEGFNFGKKKGKKKKKKKTFDIDAVEKKAELEKTAGSGSSSSKGKEPASSGGAPAPGTDGAAASKVIDYAALTCDFVLPKKKKPKKPKVPEEFALETDEAGEAEGAELDESAYTDNSPWAGTDRDYTYNELLERVFGIMRDKGQSTSGDKGPFKMKPPQVVRLGSKKSGFINFVEICKLMHRTPEHVLAYLLAELGTSGTLDGASVLVLKGRWQQKQIEAVLKRYIREYVMCSTCRSPDTILSRANRMFFLTCETCGARYSVATISAGFAALVGRRSRIRAAQGK